MTDATRFFAGLLYAIPLSLLLWVLLAVGLVNFLACVSIRFM